MRFIRGEDAIYDGEDADGFSKRDFRPRAPDISARKVARRVVCSGNTISSGRMERTTKTKTLRWVRRAQFRCRNYPGHRKEKAPELSVSINTDKLLFAI